eukprot:1184753-Rhodomonas_salina.1
MEVAKWNPGTPRVPGYPGTGYLIPAVTKPEHRLKGAKKLVLQCDYSYLSEPIQYPTFTQIIQKRDRFEKHLKIIDN